MVAFMKSKHMKSLIFNLDLKWNFSSIQPKCVCVKKKHEN